MFDDKDQWKETAGLAADSTVAQIVCKEPDKGYRSTSKYLYELVQEARAYRQQGYLAHHQSEEKIAELKSRIKELETQLKREKKKESGTTDIDVQVFLNFFLCFLKLVDRFVLSDDEDVEVGEAEVRVSFSASVDFRLPF